jgi:hypothetical protein
METARVARAIDGDELYQQRARAALPILVRQAHAGAKIYYAELASELKMPNPRTLNYPLGSIGTALEELSKEWGEKIPAIQCLVVNQDTGLPGEGIGWFVRDIGEFKALPLRNRRAIVDGVLANVFAYPRWNEVLKAFDLKPLDTGYAQTLEAASHYQGGGESEAHVALKRYVAAHPRVVNLPARTPAGMIEHPLASGDSLDVYFATPGLRLAVEVKSRISPPADIVRGLFQCVKYRAVLTAMIAVENSSDSSDAVLVLEGALPADLQVMRTILGVTVIENVAPH